MQKRGGEKVCGLLVISIVTAWILGIFAPAAAASTGTKNEITVGASNTVIIGQKLLFQGPDVGKCIVGMAPETIEGVVIGVTSNNFDSMLFPTPGTYFVDSNGNGVWDGAGETTLSVAALTFTLSLKIGGDTIISAMVGQVVDVSVTTNIPDAAQADIRLWDPHGIACLVDGAGQRLTNLDMGVIDGFGLNTTDFGTGDWEIYIKTDKDEADGLDASSNTVTLRINEVAIILTASNAEPVVGQSVKFTVFGPPDTGIIISTDEPDVAEMRVGIEKVPWGIPSWDYNGEFLLDGVDPGFHTNEYGLFTFVMRFNDDRIVNIKVQSTDLDPVIDDDLDIDVRALDVELIVDRTVVLGEDIELKGTANAGKTVDIFVEEKIVANDEDIDNGEFAFAIETGPDAALSELRRTGSVKIEVIVDRDYTNADLGVGENSDASVIVRLVSGDLTAEQYDDVLTTEDEDYGISGTAAGVDEVAVLIFGPKGGSQIMTPGDTFIEISVDEDDDTFEEDGVFTTNSDTATGTYTTVIVSRGCDGVYGRDINQDLSDYYAGMLTGKTANQILEILASDLWDAAGSDDLYAIMQFKIESAWIMLDEIADVGAGEPLTVIGTTNRADGTSILVTITGPSVLAGDVDEVEDGTFGVTIDTEGAAEGTYTITADDGDGNTDTTTVEIGEPANYPPTAIIDSIIPNPAKQGRDIISFIGHGDDPDGSVVAYNWIASSDGLLNTSPSFTKPASELSVGTHTIYFMVQDDDGAWSSADAEILTILTNQPPVASFSYLPVKPSINETVFFNASASYDPDGSIVSYTWSFGDGTFTNTTALNVTHSYASVGNYTVNLTVTDDEGATNTRSQELQVSLKPPIATFSFLPQNPVVNETVTFNASESYDPNGFIIAYAFEFGDGTTAAGEVVTHSYSSVGTYTVNLTLTDNEGAMNRTSQTIKVFSNISYFDTEPGTYPSISGIHNGTIKMTHTVNVSTIYLYPCAGTGGHIEYAKIWKTPWDGAEAHWNGYVDDWHNLSFDKNFTLVAGETYNYTIRTGSYPQIHHKSELLTAKGWITCTSFVDVNDGRHEGWIPAIRLE